MDSYGVLGDCVSRNVATTITFSYVTKPVVVLISLQWMVVSLEKLLISLKVSKE